MKNLLILLALFLLLATKSNAQFVDVDINVTYNTTTEADSVYLFLFQTTEIAIGQKLPETEIKFAFHGSHHKISVPPGAYAAGVLAFGTKPLVKPVYIPPVENFKIELELNPAIIGWGGITSIDKINKVTLRGDFNSFGEPGEIPMTRKDNTWILEEKPDVLKEGTHYAFFVNGQETSDLLNPNVSPLMEWVLLKNIYSNNELIFDPSLYSLTYKESVLRTSEPEKQKNFVELVAQVNMLDKKLEDSRKTAVSKEISLNIIDSLLWEHEELEKHYDSELKQIILDREIRLLCLKFMMASAQGNVGNTITDEQKAYFLDEQGLNNFQAIIDKLNQLDPKSYLLTPVPFLYLLYTQSTISQLPEFFEKQNLPIDYLDQFQEDFIHASPDYEFRTNILMVQVNYYANNNPNKAIEILREIKNNEKYEPFTEPLGIDFMLARLTVKVGKQAPPFSIICLNGNRFNLSDQPNKFVFVDFWGSWCPPCINAIPKIEKLYASVSHDKLEVIGLIQDDESKAKSCIEKYNIEYPNAMVSDEIIAKYGISNLPSSFLIHPNGKIIRMNIQDESEFELIAEEIENYYR
ncbi:redoxin domain-containing protein [Draconibacterium sediminis]|uniref:redoxin domain-containing protein n=1 Tax=Draconibacterium sediminis TaxID=1544798 RepID=UPI0026EA66E1|nr:redoxin domain-containing protein [Draconibacterium sediminis]